MFYIKLFFLDADIDTLCVIPSLITREEFFDEMSKFLLSNHRVHDLNVVKDSFVPVIKFKYDDISVSNSKKKKVDVDEINMIEID